MKHFIPILVIMITAACDRPEEDPQHLIDLAIETSGGELYDHVAIEFIFRDKEYGYKKQDGQFEYVRIFKDTSGLVRDVLTNNEFYREVNGERVSLPDSMKVKYSNSVNSVIYFALLPYGLNDPAVIKSAAGTEIIKGTPYDRVEVKFTEEGGGEDYEDKYMYWINLDTHTVDYLAYSYKTDGGGIRFREAYNSRIVNGIRFVDYHNYKPNKAVKLTRLPELLEQNQLDKVSTISLKNIQVNILN